MKKFIDIFKKSIYVFNGRQKARLCILTLILFIEVIFELLGVVSVYPFIALILNPGMIQSNRLLRFLYQATRCSSNELFFVYVALGIILLYVIKNVFNAAGCYLRFGFVYSTKREIGVRLMNDYMKESYSFFLKNNSSVLMASITNDVSIFFDMVLQSLYFFSDGFIVIAFGVYLFYIDFILSSVCFCVMFLFVFVFVKWNKKRLKYYGEEGQKAAARMTQWLQQAFGGVKEIKILQREKYFVQNYEKYCAIANRMLQRFSFLNQIPHVVLETFCTAAILLVIVFKVTCGTDVNVFVPKMAVFAMALFRIFPRVNRLNQSLNTMLYSSSYLDKVYNDIKLTEANFEKKEIKQELGKKEKSLTFNSEIKLENVTYRYPDTEFDVLSGINLTIKKGQAVGLVGSSGSGKSTLADVFLGILDLEKGSVLCDCKNIENHSGEWALKLGYIPQSIFLSDDTIRNNVAFGLEVDSNVDKKVWNALEQAQLADYVRTLPEGLDTMVGERGVRFSGGQRQRIGIARALYNNPEILVFDEATSALDNETEKAVMESIEHLLGHKTMIIIAHRITTIKNCDVIYKVENGNVFQVFYKDLLDSIK